MSKYMEEEFVRDFIRTSESELADEIELTLLADYDLDWKQARKLAEVAAKVVVNKMVKDFKDRGLTPDEWGFLPRSVCKAESIILRQGSLVGSGTGTYYYYRVLTAVASTLPKIAEKDLVTVEERALLEAAREAYHIRQRKKIKKTLKKEAMED